MGGVSAKPMSSHDRAEVSELMGVLELQHVEAVVLFGSVARGDFDERSDLDMLVVLDADDARRELRDRLRASTALTATPLLLTGRSLLDELAIRPSFVSHLLDEGVTIYQGEAWGDLRSELQRRVADRDALAKEVRSRVRHLRPLLDPDRFSKSPVTALSHLYGISRSLVIAHLLQEGIHEYRWREAFDRYAEVRPDLAGDLEALSALRPYYEYARARAGATPPQGVVSIDKVRELIHSARQLAG